MKKDNLLELLLEERMNGALEQELTTNICYKDTNKRIDKLLQKLDKMKMNRKQRLAVDRLLSAYNSNSSEYGRAAYRQGFKDCLKLIDEFYQLRENI